MNFVSRTPARITQADISRALRAAQSAGATWRVEIAPDGTIRLVQGELSTQSRGRSQDVPLADGKDWRL